MRISLIVLLLLCSVLFWGCSHDKKSGAPTDGDTSGDSSRVSNTSPASAEFIGTGSITPVDFAVDRYDPDFYRQEAFIQELYSCNAESSAKKYRSVPVTVSFNMQLNREAHFDPNNVGRFESRIRRQHLINHENLEKLVILTYFDVLKLDNKNYIQPDQFIAKQECRVTCWDAKREFLVGSETLLDSIGKNIEEDLKAAPGSSTRECHFEEPGEPETAAQEGIYLGLEAVETTTTWTGKVWCQDPQGVKEFYKGTRIAKEVRLKDALPGKIEIYSFLKAFDSKGIRTPHTPSFSPCPYMERTMVSSSIEIIFEGQTLQFGRAKLTELELTAKPGDTQ